MKGVVMPRINWTNKEQVIAFAKKLAACGPPQAVIATATGYGITFVERIGNRTCVWRSDD